MRRYDFPRVFRGIGVGLLLMVAKEIGHLIASVLMWMGWAVVVSVAATWVEATL